MRAFIFVIALGAGAGQVMAQTAPKDCKPPNGQLVCVGDSCQCLRRTDPLGGGTILTHKDPEEPADEAGAPKIGTTSVKAKKASKPKEDKLPKYEAIGPDEKKKM